MNTSTEPLNFEALPPFEPRRFVDPKADLKDLSTLKALYQQLLGHNLESSEQLRDWLMKRSELEAALRQQGDILYIRMTCQTDDPARANAYKHFIEHIVPQIKPLEDQLNKFYAEAVKRLGLPDEHYALYNRAIETDLKLFTEKNVPLETEVAVLSQEYQATTGAMTVNFEGKERTLPEVGKFLLEPDRAVRESAWRATSARRLKDKDKLEGLFSRMLTLRHTIAVNAGFKNYLEYKFASMHRFDYTPSDCKTYHDTVKELVVPLWGELLKKRAARMGLKSLRPWDTSVDPLGRRALAPFKKVDALIKGCGQIFSRLDGELGGQFEGMVEAGLLDLESRKGKAPGGYQCALDEARRPFIFMNAVGIDGDVRTLLHEGGHAFHAMASVAEPLIDYRHGPMEFNEVASMAMELLADKYLDEFYNDEDAKRSRVEHLESVVFILPWVATVDKFQHWIYEHPEHTADERKTAWLRIHQEFGGQFIDWSSLEEEHAYVWHRQLHIFEVPFYYIEYGIAQLGALQLWLNAQKDERQAVRDYKRALSFGGSKPLPELYRSAGITFDFSRDTIAPLVQAVRKELNALGL